MPDNLSLFSLVLRTGQQIVCCPSGEIHCILVNVEGTRPVRCPDAEGSKRTEDLHSVISVSLSLSLHRSDHTLLFSECAIEKMEAQSDYSRKALNEATPVCLFSKDADPCTERSIHLEAMANKDLA
jgi:hypothetical protein